MPELTPFQPATHPNGPDFPDLTPIQVKVCGITRAIDAAELDALGIEWLGFNFWPGSKRYIPPVKAKPLVSALSNSIPVGVFVNPTLAEVEKAIAESGIRWVQLHGTEDWNLIQSIPIPVIKAIPNNRLEDLAGLRNKWPTDLGSAPNGANPLQYLLIDTQTGTGFGGTGEAFDWSLLTAAALPLPFFLAGGIGPGNLRDAVTAVRPFAVDLNSKVETSPGLKDVTLVQACLRILKPNSA